MARVLDNQKLLETAEQLGKQINQRFPRSGLSEVAAEISGVIKDALVRAERIHRPDLLLRAGQGLLVLLAALGIGLYLRSSNDQTSTMDRVLQFLDSIKGAAAFLIAAAVFLVTLEVRLKRRRALKAIHELRALAHIIDMHQLAKDPDRLGHRETPILVGGQVLDADAMGRYLHYCTELLALVSKVGQLYVQDFPDAPALAAADQFENLATGLSSKIWQKIMILDRVRVDAEGGASNVRPPAAGPARAPEPAPPAKAAAPAAP